MDNAEHQQAEGNRIRVSGIDLEWHPEKGACTFDSLPVAMMWVDTTLAGVMSGVQAMVGTTRFLLALQSEGRKSVEADWQVISGYRDFREGFKAIANIAAVAGWGHWTLSDLDEDRRECRFRAKDSWEGRYQKALGVCWGSGMLAGKMAGYCSKLFGTNCWADQTAFIAKGDACDEFVVRPSSRSIEKEIDNLLASDEATRADMAVALRNLEREIAERQRAEEALRESRRMLAQILDSLPQSIFWKDLNSVFLGCNEVFARAAGFDSPEQLVGKTDFDLPAPRKEAEAYRADDREVIEHNRPKRHITERFWQADGTRLWIDTTKVPLVDETGRVYGVLGVYEDITERKLAEEERLRLEAQLRHAQKMEAIGTLATGIAHDFNNLLTAISGYTEMARAALAVDHPARQFLDIVDTAVRDAGGIANSLLTFSRKTTVAKAPVDLCKVVRDSLKLLRRILPASIEVQESLPADGPVYVYADVGQLHQVLMNLITNARDAMPDGGTLRISLLQDREAAASATGPVDEETGPLLVIEDTGVGMSQEVASKIFDPFFTTKPRGKGTGLGMAMVHGIIQEHGGDIYVESQPGRGTRISVRLPSCEPPRKAADAEKAGVASTVGRGRTILLADDDEFVRTIMTQTLKASGFAVVDLASGAGALARFKDSPGAFALVILDVDLPEMSGVRCLEEIRKEHPRLPVLLVAGSPEIGIDEDKDEHLLVLRKPFKMSQLTSLARILLADGESGP